MRIIVPNEGRKRVLETLHRANQGIICTKQRARNAVCWPGITNDIEQMIERCEVCQEKRPSQAPEPMLRYMKPSIPFEMLSADLFSYGGRAYLIYADHL